MDLILPMVTMVTPCWLILTLRPLPLVLWCRRKQPQPSILTMDTARFISGTAEVKVRLELLFRIIEPTQSDLLSSAIMKEDLLSWMKEEQMTGESEKMSE